MYQSAMESHEDTPESDCQSMVSNDVLDREDHYGDDHDNFEGWKIIKVSPRETYKNSVESWGGRDTREG